MVERIKIAIEPNVDNFSAYLIQTAALACPWVEPLIGPDIKALRERSSAGTVVLSCRQLSWKNGNPDTIVIWSHQGTYLHVQTADYLSADGSIDHAKAEAARREIEAFLLKEVLLEDKNQLAALVEYFPLLWKHRRRIYGNPQYCFVHVPLRDTSYISYPHVYLGAFILARETNTAHFRVRFRGGCSCTSGTILLDYTKDSDRGKDKEWELSTWCPACGARRTVQTRSFDEWGECERSVRNVDRAYRFGAGASGITLFDVIDELKRL